MAWIYLVIAGVLEVAWAIGMKYSDGYSRLWPSVFTVIGQIASFVFLTLATKELPLGTAYSVWTGVGAVGTVIAGILLFGESREAARLLCLGLIVLGILGLRLTTPE